MNGQNGSAKWSNDEDTMLKDQIMQMANSQPEFAQAVDAMEAQIARMPIVPEDMDEMIKMLEFIVEHPDKYSEVLEAAISDGEIDVGMMPEQYDQVFIISLLVALYGLQERLTKQGYARGGLAVAGRRLAAQGRGGDSMLAHVNPREAQMLRRAGGSGTTNPMTGLPEYKFSFKKLLGAVLPIVLNFIIPGIGGAIGTAFGASAGIGANILGGTILGAGSSALSGGNVLKGALMGGLGGGAAGALGKTANNALGLNLGGAGQAVLGSTIAGAGAGLATGEGAGKGALQGLAGGAIGQIAGNFNNPTALHQGIQAGGATFGEALTAGYDPKTAAIAGGLSGISKGYRYKHPSPSDAVVNNLQNGTSQGPQNVKMPDGTMSPAPGTAGSNAQGQPGTYQLNPTTGQVALVASPGNYAVNPTTGAIEWKVAEPSFFDKVMGRTAPTAGTTPANDGVLGNLGKVALTTAAIGAVSGGSGLQDAPVQVQDAVKTLSPMQQEYFTRPSISWNWDKLQKDANQNNLSLNQFMARNWQQVASGAYNVQAQPQPQPTVQAAGGGALADIARFARGAGSGRADTIDAKLSDGEYVIDAETVAMLGDGSNQAGAQLLDQMRENVRTHKGKALARGKISPNAKSPLMYLKLKGVK